MTVFNNFVAILKGMRERHTRAAEEIDQLERRRAALQAKLKAEFEDGHKKLDELHVKIREAERKHEKVVKETDRKSREIGQILDDVIMGKRVA